LPAYPEQYNDRWRPCYKNNEGKELNGDRRYLPLGIIRTTFKNYIPQSHRTQMDCLVLRLNDAAKRELLKAARSREDLINHNKINSLKYFGCRCELRIYAGDMCKHNLAKGPDGKTLNMPNNPHWQWEIDVAPRGFVCPRALERHFKGEGDPLADGCPILLFDEPPRAEWVLAQDPSDAPGTLAGRAVTDKVRVGKPCFHCDGVEVDDATNRVRRSQAHKFAYNGEE
jgi:hypothetical protein